MLLIDAELRTSEIHGIGLFCREAIPKGTKIWAFNPLIDLELDETDILALPAPALKFIRTYAYRARDNQKFIINVDLARHMNHSENPTLISDLESNYYSAEYLPPGTELTCDYRIFALEGCSDFLDRQPNYSQTTAANENFALAAES